MLRDRCDDGKAVSGLDEAGYVARCKNTVQACAVLDGRDACLADGINARDDVTGPDRRAEILRKGDQAAVSGKGEAWRRTLSAPLRAISMEVALAVPAPPSSVVTKTLPMSSAVVSSMPTASISSIFME
jgi:hypothetical protein